MNREQIKANLISAEKVPGGYRPTGSPFIICLKAKDLDKLAEMLSSGEKPFRILGTKSKVAGDQYVIYGVNLETACPVEMEVTPSWITVHPRRIPGDNDGEDCVEALLELYENIKRHVDENATLERGVQ